MPSATPAAPVRGPVAALRQLADLVIHPHVLGVLAVFWAALWAVLVLGYQLAAANAMRSGFAIPAATYDAGVWAVQAALAFTGGWLVPVGNRPTPRQVGSLVGVAGVLMLARVGAQQLAIPNLGLKQWTALESLLFYFPRHMLVLTSCAAGGSALRVLVRGWQREAEVWGLEASVARARLEMLRNRVGPGFLADSLNAISRMMEDAPRAADALLLRTGELLRARLRAAGAAAVPLGDDLALAALYVEVAQGGGGRPVRLQLDVPASLNRWSVPPCTVSWLVEAVLLAAGEGAEPVEVRVHVAEAADALRLGVADDLPLPLLRRTGRGEWDLVAALGDLLRDRYGDAGWVRAADREPAGVAVQVRIPAPAPDPAPRAFSGAAAVEARR
jgi:hypothetical protein